VLLLGREWTQRVFIKHKFTTRQVVPSVPSQTCESQVAASVILSRHENEATEFTLNAKDRAELEKIVGDGNAAQKVAKRAKIVLMTAAGAGVMAIMRTVSVSKTTVWRWQKYFVKAGVAGVIKGRSKPPGKKPIAEKTVKERPANATHWSVRIMGEVMISSKAAFMP
jgi:hypothetical protein